MDRFQAKALWENSFLFEVWYEHQPESFQKALFEMGLLLNIETEDLISQMRSAFSIRNVILRSGAPASAEALWLAVLRDLRKEGGCEAAIQLICAFLLSPSQAASCERAFAEVTRLRATLVDAAPAVIEKYLLVGNIGQTIMEAMRKGGIVSEAADQFLAKQRRSDSGGSDELGCYRLGRKLIARKRKQRSDARCKRSSYKSKKRHAGLRELPNARLLRRGEGEMVEMQVPPLRDIEEHDIFVPMSPRKSKQKTTDDA